MARDSEMMMVLVDFLEGLKAGTRLLANDLLVRAHPRFFVPFAEGDRAVILRKAELDQERHVASYATRATELAERFSQSTKPLNTDDAITESAKLAVQRDKSLELAFDAEGHVIGTRFRNREQQAPVGPMHTGYVG